MKTLVVISALAAIATAAPALPESRYSRYRSVPYQITPAFRREKKSPTEDQNNVPVQSPADFPRTELNEEVSGRTFEKKKPIIIKKKAGYHLYRDSDEEQAQADSQEKCTKEVKVKLCDAENLQAKSSTLKENSGEVKIHQSDKEMEHSIKMAKETVENLQKSANWKHSEFGPDAEIHQDIEVARQALAHIQQNFGNLEAMNMKTATLNDAEALNDAQSQITEDARMAKWKEAINNIQKNAEIARNLEDSFSLKNEHERLSHIQKPDLTTQEKSSDLANSENLNSLHDEKLHFNKLAAKEAKIGHESLREEMKAASEINEVKLMRDQEQKTTARDGMPIKPFQELSHDTLFRSKSEHVEKNIHTGMKTPTRMDVETNKAKHSDSVEMALKSAVDTIKSAEVNHDSKQHNIDEFVMKQDSKDSLHNLENSKRAWIESEDKNTIAKASEHISTVEQKQPELKADSLLIHENTSKFDSSTSRKSGEHQEHEHFHDKSIEKDDMLKKHTHNAVEKSIDQVSHMSEQVSARVMAPLTETDSSAKMVKHMNAEHPHQVQNFHSQAKNWHADHLTSMNNAAVEASNAHLDFNPSSKHFQTHHIASMKNAAIEQSIADLHNAEMQRAVAPGSHLMPPQHQAQFADHAHHHHSHHPSQIGNLVNMQLGMPPRAVHEFKPQQKAAEMDNTVEATVQVKMNGPSEKSALEHNAHWKQQQTGAARGAYGAYGLSGPVPGAIGGSIGAAAAGSGGPGAIGIFPNANIGGCAIPLLLSCSPSVVPGSLAKSHSGYGAPAYRAGENFNVHTKRDIRKTNEILAAKAQRTPTKVIQKIPYALDKKN